MSDLFGWDLVYKLSESGINKKEDVLTLLIHFLLIKNGFKCCGSGEDAEGEGSEVLPGGWSSSDSYSLNYVCQEQRYVLRGLQVNNSLVFNLLDTGSLEVSNVALVTEKEVTALRGDIKAVLTDADSLMKRIDSNLIRPVRERLSNNKEATTQTPSADQRPPQAPYSDPYVSPLRSDSRSSVGMVTDPLRIGGADLDPLGGLAGPDGGGMLFDPFHQPRLPDTSGLPRGSVPPGARFDPFAPPGAGLPPRRPRGPPDFNSMDPFGGGFSGGFGGGFI